MSRPPRLEFAGAFYHVFSRGNRRETIFRDGPDYSFFQSLMLDLALNCHIDLYAWCLMPNHFHLVLGTPRANLSMFMRRLLTHYATVFNKRYDLVGHVFQGRYRALICEQEAYFFDLIRYVHNNPLGKAKNPLVEKLNDWSWSSHPLYCAGKDVAGAKVTSGLGKFGPNVEAAIANYQEFMKRSPKEDQHLEKNGIYGSETFIEEAKKKGDEDIRRQGRMSVEIISVTDLVRHAETVFGLSPEDLASASSNKTLSAIRKAVAFVGRTRFRFGATELGRLMGRGPAAISRMVGKIEIRRHASSEVSRLNDSLKGAEVLTEQDESPMFCKR